MFFVGAVTHIVIDVFILTIPLPLIWNLQMPLQQKIAVSGMFLLGALVCTISIARFVFFTRAGAAFDGAYDVTYKLAPTIYWTQMEGALAVVSACLPTLRPVFGDLSPASIIRIFRSRRFRPFGGRKSSAGSSSAQRDPLCSDYHLSLSGFDKNANDAIPENSVESIR
ncbi:hypothetical protein MMC22_005576 [Lobaria immixta]|nr:hypothetical protein [Lobaria immixta]